MSIRFYAYRIRKDCWWDFARACHEFYLSYCPLMVLVKAATEGKTVEEQIENFSKIQETLNKADLATELQLFDVGEHYIVRPLENGWFFKNQDAEWIREFGLERVFYDDRSDVPTEEEPNREIALRCDDLIERGEYLMFSVISNDDALKWCLNQMLDSSS